MLTAALKRELELAVETAVMLADSDTPDTAIAARLYDAEPALMEKLARPLAVERMIWTMKRRRQHIPSQDQMVLPGFPNLPQRIRLKDGSRPLLMQSTIKQLREFRQILMKRKGARLIIVEKLIDFMTPYSVKKSTITVAEIVARQAGT
jgi:hypothetical protein